MRRLKASTPASSLRRLKASTPVLSLRRLKASTPMLSLRRLKAPYVPRQPKSAGDTCNFSKMTPNEEAFRAAYVSEGRFTDF